MTKARKQVGFLGGTFDPIHIGHLHLALEAKEHFGLDEVLFCPSYCSPFKQQEVAIASPEERLAMTKLAVEGIHGCTVVDYEIKLHKVSYTVDTLKYLKKTFPEQEFFLILGEDHSKTFMQWKDPLEIMKIAPVRVGSREGSFNSYDVPVEYRKTFQEGFFTIHNLEISSTYLRERLRKKLYCHHLIPPKVVDYIQSRRLYSTHSSSS